MTRSRLLLNEPEPSSHIHPSSASALSQRSPRSFTNIHDNAVIRKARVQLGDNRLVASHQLINIFNRQGTAPQDDNLLIRMLFQRPMTIVRQNQDFLWFPLSDGNIRPSPIFPFKDSPGTLIIIFKGISAAQGIDLNNESSEALFPIIQNWGTQTRAQDLAGSLSYELPVLVCRRDFPEDHAECDSLKTQQGSFLSEWIKIGGEQGDILFESIKQAHEAAALASGEGDKRSHVKIHCSRLVYPAAPAPLLDNVYFLKWRHLNRRQLKHTHSER